MRMRKRKARMSVLSSAESSNWALKQSATQSDDDDMELFQIRPSCLSASAPSYNGSPLMIQDTLRPRPGCHTSFPCHSSKRST